MRSRSQIQNRPLLAVEYTYNDRVFAADMRRCLLCPQRRIAEYSCRRSGRRERPDLPSSSCAEHLGREKSYGQSTIECDHETIEQKEGSQPFMTLTFRAALIAIVGAIFAVCFTNGFV